jgi:UPF0755 protein
LANTEDFGYEFIKKIPSGKYKLEGYLFPDTYYFDLKTPDKEILKIMVDNFDQKNDASILYKSERIRNDNARSIDISFNN